MLKNLGLTTLAFALLCPLAEAAEPNYDYLEFGTSFRRDGEHIPVYSILGSTRLSDNFFLQGNYTYAHEDIEKVGENWGVKSEISSHDLSAGLGYRLALNDSTDWNIIGTVGHSRYKHNYDTTFPAQDAPFTPETMHYEDAGQRTYFNLGTGVRSMVTEQLELGAQLALHTGGVGDVKLDNVSLGVDAAYYVTPAIAATLGYTPQASELSNGVWTIGLRMGF